MVAGKVHFTKNVEELEHFIPRSHIIKELGGDENWEYKYVEPVPNENAKMQDGARRDELSASRAKNVLDFQESTHAWISAAAAGHDTADIKNKRNALATELRDGYWQLDSFLRARTFYDRTNMIRDQGRISFYGDSNETTESKAVKENGVANTEASPSNDDVD